MKINLVTPSSILRGVHTHLEYDYTVLPMLTNLTRDSEYLGQLEYNHNTIECTQAPLRYAAQTQSIRLRQGLNAAVGSI